MATMNDIVLGALKRLRVSNPRKALDAVAGTEGLTALNDMMHSWKASGVDVDHDTADALTDDFTLGDEHIQGVKALLAVRLAGEYGLEVNAGIVRDAQMEWAALEAEFIDAPTQAEFDSGLTRLSFGRTVGTSLLE